MNFLSIFNNIVVWAFQLRSVRLRIDQQFDLLKLSVELLDVFRILFELIIDIRIADDIALLFFTINSLVLVLILILIFILPIIGARLFTFDLNNLHGRHLYHLFENFLPWTAEIHFLTVLF